MLRLDRTVMVNVTKTKTVPNSCMHALTCEPWYMQASLEGEM